MLVYGIYQHTGKDVGLCSFEVPMGDGSYETPYLPNKNLVIRILERLKQENPDEVFTLEEITIN